MTSPRLKNTLLIWVLILAPILCIAVFEMKFFDADITIAELIAYTITLISACYGLWKLGAYIKYRHAPFYMRYQKSIRYKKDMELYENKITGIGETEINLRIIPKRSQIFERIHVRLVNEKRWFNVGYPLREDIAVTKIRAEDLIGNDKMEYREDNTNGLQGKYEPPFHRSPEEGLVLVLNIMAKKPWKGFIVFRSKRKYDRQYCSYLPLEAKIE